MFCLDITVRSIPKIGELWSVPRNSFLVCHVVDSCQIFGGIYCLLLQRKHARLIKVEAAEYSKTLGVLYQRTRRHTSQNIKKLLFISVSHLL
jgi:hypothetical protein